MALEKRNFKRVPFGVNILIDGVILVKGIDISEGGLYVHTGRQCAINRFVTVKFTLSGRELTLKAQVMSCQESVGMGLNFVNVGEFEMSLIRRYISEFGGSATALKKTTVLLVEDNDLNRRMNKSKLVLEGFAVTEANDGFEAIRKLSEVVLDVVVLDLYMERMDGYKLLSYIRSTDHLKNIPVVILSGRMNQSEVDRAMSFGADGFLVKMSTSPAKLSDYLKKMLHI